MEGYLRLRKFAPEMSATTTEKIHYTALDFLFGEKVTILNSEKIVVNNFVQIQWLDVDVNDISKNDTEGRLYLFPFEDNRFQLDLLYPAGEDDHVTSSQICWVQFKPEFFQLFDYKEIFKTLPFKIDRVSEQQFNMDAPTKMILNQIKNYHSFLPITRSIQLTETALQLLRRSLEQVNYPFEPCPVPACRFLAHESERQKIIEAQQILEESYDHPMTIKELSRKVAMNECYLKKGFKTLTGKTINEYQQHLRISKAKILLQEKGKTVSEVASELGYSSISHFSTAFKKATGMKPCELLA